MKFIPMLIACVSLTLLITSCNRVSVETLDELTDCVFALFGSQENLNENFYGTDTKTVIVEMDGRSAEFGRTEGRTINSLSEIFREGRLSGGDKLIGTHGWKRKRVGRIIIISNRGKLDFPLFRSRTEPHLYAVEVYDIHGTGSSLVFFLDAENRLEKCTQPAKSE